MEKRVGSAKSKRRASAACKACRKSRTRCILGIDDPQCLNCLQSEQECIFDQKDGRKCRQSAKSVVNDLTERIKHLEGLLEEQNMKQSTHDSGNHSVSQSSSVIGESASFDRPADGSRSKDGTSLVQTLVPSPVRFDMASGRVRCFGPTTSMNVLTETSLNRSLDRKNSHWAICAIVKDLSPETHDYLMDTFWSCYNSVVHLVHMIAFYEDRDTGRTQFYSTFLHLAILAIGFRYADKSRPDIKRLSVPGNASSTLHAKAKDMAKLEIEKPGGIPSIQGFILLGDLECLVGRDDSGWMFGGMAFRLVFDVGLHIDPTSLQLSKRESLIRHMVLWACILNDKFWSLYLGRPTVIKTEDVSPACLLKDFGPLISCRPFGQGKQLTTKVYEALLMLIDIVGQMCDLDVKQPETAADNYFKIAAVETELTTWYGELSEELQWKSENINSMPASFFLLHTHYHSALILLHRPHIKHRESRQEESSFSTGNDDYNRFLAFSREVCTENAKRVATILQQYQRRFNISQIFPSALQHAGTAATSLMVEIMNHRDTEIQNELISYLTVLKSAMVLMSETYQPAVLMSSAIQHFLQDIKNQLNSDDLAFAGTEQNSQDDCSKRKADEEIFEIESKRPRPYNSLTGKSLPQSPDEFPYLPVSWLEDLTAEDAALLNLNFASLSQVKHTAAQDFHPVNSVDWTFD